MTTITVTKKDISKGCSHSDSCPVALAIKRVVKKSIEVHVHFGQISVDHWAVVQAPMVRKFIDAFDDNRPVKPLQFRLRIPKRLLK